MPRKNYTPGATPMSVSRHLGEHMLDGKKLGRARIRQASHGPEELGGFKVSRGSGPGRVAVRYIAPDDMPEDRIEENRNFFLTVYTAVLEAKGFTVNRHSYGLSVSRVYE